MKKLMTAIQVGLVIIIIFSAKTIYDYKQNLDETDNIVEKTRKVVYQLEHENEKEVDYVDPVDLSKQLLQTLKEDYPDTVAHININNTQISYPIVQTNNNDFYLTHSPNKSYNANGSIFMSALNSPDFTDDNTVIYGHNIRTGKLFQNLHLFRNQDFYNNNQIINIHTQSGPKNYLIFSVYKTNPEYQYKTPNYETVEEKLLFVNEIANKSVVKPTKDISEYIEDENLRLITLSTCETGGKERVVVHGIELPRGIKLMKKVEK